MSKKKKKQNKIQEFLFKDRLTYKEKIEFFENFSMILASGLDISSSLEVLKEETKSKALSIVIEKIENNIKEGFAVWESIKIVDLLPQHLLSVVEIGEKGGTLKENLRIVVTQIQKEKEFNGKVLSASLYPVFVLVLVLVVGAAMSLFVLPRITSVYKSLKVELPGITQVLINLGDFFAAYGTIVVPSVLIILLLLFFILFINKPTKHWGQNIMFSLPVIGRLLVEVEVSRMGILLGSLLESGYPLLKGMDLLADSTRYKRYKLFYEFVRDRLEYGASYRDIMKDFRGVDKVFPSYARQLILSSEKTGDLNKTLLNLGEIYEKKHDNTLKNLTVLIEPVLLITVWLGVAFVALSIVLPIYNLVGNINQTTNSRNITN